MIFSSRHLSSLLAAVAALAATTTTTIHAQSYDCTLSEPLQLDDDLTLEQVKNDAAGTYTMRLTYTGGLSWIGIGINRDGDSGMAPATAVIGRHDATTTNNVGQVLFYDMTSDDKDGSGVVPVANQQLMDASFTQTDTTSTLQFTQYLNDGNQQVTDESSWIFAVGLPDNIWEGKHKIHGSFFLPLTNNCQVVATPAPPIASPTEATVAAATTQDDGQVTAQDESAASEQDGASSVTAAPPAPNTPTATSQQTTSSTTTTTSTMNSSSTTSASSTTASAGLVVRESPSSKYRKVWMAHGWLLAIAWGLLVPISVGVAILKHVPCLSENGRWYQIHWYGNVLAIVSTIVGFALAVWATDQEAKDQGEIATHFSEDVHHQAGLAICILAVIQGVVADFRPGLPQQKAAEATSSDSGSNQTAKDLEAEGDDDMDPSHAVVDVTGHPPPSPGDTTGSSLDGDLPSDQVIDEPAPRKSLIRVAWEMMHRLMALVLVGLAWYNCHSGYELMAANYGAEYDMTAVFWGVAAGISGSVVLLVYVVRI